MSSKIEQLISAIFSGNNKPNTKQSVSRNVANILVNQVVPLAEKENTNFEEIEFYHYGFSQLVHDCALAMAAEVLEPRHVKKIINDCWYHYIGYDIVQYCKESKILDEVSGDQLTEIVEKVMLDNQRAVEELRSGKDKAIGALVGAVLKLHKTDPKKVQEIIRSKL